MIASQAVFARGVTRRRPSSALLGAAVLAAALLPSGRGLAAPEATTLPPATGSPAAATPSPTAAGAPLAFDGKTLFHVSGQLGPFSAEDRAAAAAQRLRKLARQAFAGDIVLTVGDNETTTDILAGEKVLASVSDSEAAAAGVDRRALAESRARVIERAVNRARREIGVKQLVVDGLWVLLVTVLLIFLFVGLRRGTPAVLGKLEMWRGTRIPAIRIQKLEIVSATRMTDALKGLVRAIRLAILVTAVLVYVPIALSFFPWTRGLVGPLFGYVATPLKSIWWSFVVYLPDLFFLVVIIILTRWGLKLVRLFFTEIENGTIAIAGFERDWATPTYDIARFLVIAFAAVVAFPYIPGSQSAAFKGVSLFLGVLFSLSSSSAISNIVAGVILTYTKAFRVGDRVKIADTVGDVIEKSLLVTRVRTIKNVHITIPNGMVLGSHILNYSTSARERALILNTSVTIGYDAPWRDVHGALLAAAYMTGDLLEHPPPFVLQTSLDDFYVTYEINAFTDKAGRMAATYSDLHANIQDKFNEAGIEIMSPHYGALRDGNQVTIPGEHLPKTYEAPAFRFLGVGPAPAPKPPAEKA